MDINMDIKWILKVLVVSVFFVSPSIAVPSPPIKVEQNEAIKLLQVNAEIKRIKQSGMSFNEFKLTVFKEPTEGGKYIVNGDTPIANEKKLKEFYKKSVANKPRRNGSSITDLVVHTMDNGRDAIWNNSKKRQLHYCVSDTFEHNHSLIVVAMEQASAAWESVADIDFTYIASENAYCTQNNPRVTFDVRPVNHGGYLARAFFPNDQRIDRNILIDSSSLNLDPNDKLTVTGILRHELGHVLGFRHEQTRPESGTCFEDENWRPITNYDAFSVMHYPHCNGFGDWSLTLTEADKSGIACLYNPSIGFSINTSICSTLEASNIRTEIFKNQTVDVGQEIIYKTSDTFRVKPNTSFRAEIQGIPPMQGDPDLYVRFGSKPASVNNYDCRPYLEGANEICDIDIPSNENNVSVMVRGYDKGNYNLTVTYTTEP